MRIFNRLASVVIALALVAGGLLAIVEGSLVAAGRPPLLVPLQSWYDAFTTTRVRDQAILLLSILMVVLGLLVLLSQLRPWPPDRLRIVGEGWHVQRRSVEHQIASAVQGVPGVKGARARLGKNWRLNVQASADRSLRGEVEEMVRRELELMEAPDNVRWDVRLIKPRVV